ncbi:MAG: hypothetical protein N2491_12885, partial [Negativicutes bacterium]|nr:hypothetical protein [Negativicutes bacterium]
MVIDLTVASNINKHIYLGNGATTEWPYSFPIIDKSHIKIYLTDTHGNITELINNYYVNTDTNVIIYPGWEPGTEPPEELRPPKLPAGWKLTILRKVPIVQEIDLQNQGPFY